jgi:hypothetical protein
MLPPKKRLQVAKTLFWASIVLMPPALWVTYFMPPIGTLILQAVSFGALTFTAWDIVQTADVREEQEGGENDKSS